MKKILFKFDTGIVQIEKGSIPVICFSLKKVGENYGDKRNNY